MKNFISIFLLLGVVLSCKKSEPEPTPFSIQGFDPTQGVAGTVVTIQGEGFSTDPTKNTVKFGSGTATVTGASALQLTVTVPATAQTGKITVETEGRTATSANDFTFIDGPVVASFSPGQSEEGEEVDIKGYNYTNNTVVKFNGVAAKTITRLGANELKAIVPDGATTGKITLEDAGKSGTSPTDFTVITPISAKATVSKLAGIPTTPSAGADGVRMVLTNALYITGPSQNTVYKLDLTTFGVSSFLTPIERPLSISSDGDQYYVGGRNEFYTYRYGNLTKAIYTASLGSGTFSLKLARTATNNKYSYVCTDFSNELIGIVNGTAGGNSSSSYSTTVVNTQLKGTPSDASAMLGINSKSIFVFANQTLWKLQSDNSLKAVAGSPGQAGYVDGAGSAARFKDGGYARGNAIAVDESDNVYVADYGSGCIRKVDASGNVTTVVGNKKLSGIAGSTKAGRGNRMAFSFDSWDIALATDGTLYVIANNDVQSTTLRFAVYKVVFDK